MLVELFMKYKDCPEIYSDGSLEAVLSAYSIPMKLKYDCPAPSKFGQDPPLWKTATECFLNIVKECAGRIQSFGDVISDDRVEGIWYQILDIYRGALLADCTPAMFFSLAEQEAEENFDLALLATLEIDIIPHLGADKRVPDRLIYGFGKCLERASTITIDERLTAEDVDPGSSEGHLHNGYANGTAHQPPLVPRERFSYWCFDLLCLICSDLANDYEPARRRVAALCLPAFLTRCSGVLNNYVADSKLRGGIPFPRYIEEELLYILRKLHNMRLWPGTLWAAFQDQPSEVAVEQPALDISLPPSQLIPQAVQRSTVAHLFHFHSLLCDIATLPAQPPSVWVLPSINEVNETVTVDEDSAGSNAYPQNGSPVDKRSSIGITLGAKAKAVEVNSRQLARDCLVVLGKEFGS